MPTPRLSAPTCSDIPTSRRFRQNNRRDGKRETSDWEQYQIAVGQINGKRPTHESPAGKEGEAVS